MLDIKAHKEVGDVCDDGDDNDEEDVAGDNNIATFPTFLVAQSDALFFSYRPTQR